MTLEIQKFLATCSPEEAKSLFGTSHKRRPGYPNLVMFSYSQIASPIIGAMWEAIKALNDPMPKSK